MFAESISYDGLDQQSMYFIGTAIAGIVTIIVNLQVQHYTLSIRDTLVNKISDCISVSSLSVSQS